MTVRQGLPRALLADKLNIPRAKRAKAFVEQEWTDGRYFGGKAELHSQLMRFAEQEDCWRIDVDERNYADALAAADVLMVNDPSPTTITGRLLLLLVAEIQRFESGARMELLDQPTEPNRPLSPDVETGQESFPTTGKEND